MKVDITEFRMYTTLSLSLSLYMTDRGHRVLLRHEVDFPSSQVLGCSFHMGWELRQM